ncbi:MAG: UDP-N-acetylglucosamine 1-carboxyvinyltransferase [Pseudomonadota bacterium]
MHKLRIIGGTPLSGEIHISGAKNAMLPLMTVSLLTDQVLELTNVPDLADVYSMGDLLAEHGVEQSFDTTHKTIRFHAGSIKSTTAPYDLVRKMRASILVLGPLLARCGQARVSLPGGCAIGARPVNLHLDGLKALGAEIEIDQGYINARAPKGLQGGDYRFPIVSVTGTENLMMAASLAHGTTRLFNAACEPEITDLANCLITMGAKINGAGTSQVTIEGVDRLKGTAHKVLPDRIETGTYAIAALITGGDLKLLGADTSLLPTVIPMLEQSGAIIKEINNGFHVQAPAKRHRRLKMMTQPYPGFATDLQAQLMAMLSLADGESQIVEAIFENRFMHVPELARMGADILVDGSTAHIKGVEQLNGAEVMATDLRASVSLVLAGLAAKGETFVQRIYHLDRGYQNLEQKLSACGANIERIAA